MTKQEILDALDGLKDLTNIHGKAAIDGIKAAVAELNEPKVDTKPDWWRSEGEEALRQAEAKKVEEPVMVPQEPVVEKPVEKPVKKATKRHK